MSTGVLGRRARIAGIHQPVAWALLALVGIWALVASAVAAGALALPGGGLLVFSVPVLLAAAAALVNGPVARPVRLAAGVAVTVAGALLAAPLVSAQPLLAVGAVAAFLSAILAIRRPAAVTVTAFALTGVWGSLYAYTSFSATSVVDVLLAGLWLAALWGYFLVGRRRILVWPGMAVLAIYLLLTIFAITQAETTYLGVAAFRASAWYMMAGLLVAYAPFAADTHRRIVLGLLAVVALVGAYACYRWAVGPSAAERDLAFIGAGRYNFIDGQLRLIGSFPSGHDLAAWTAFAIPFAFAQALTKGGRWRLVAAVAVAGCSVGLLGSGVRAALVAAAVGAVVVLVLYQASRGFRGLHLGGTAIAVLAVVVTGGLAFTLTTRSSGEAIDRYTVIFNPTRDPSYQERLFKWRNAIRVIERHPFGQGLGAGARVYRGGRFQQLGNLDVDNSYLKVALDQGFAVMILFIAGLLLLLGGLARRAVAATSRERAGMAMGASGTLAAMLVLFLAANYIEGLGALAGWLLVGLGAAPFATAVRDTHV